MAEHLLFFLAAYKGDSWYYSLLTHKREAAQHILWAITQIEAAGEVPAWVVDLKAQVVNNC